jgi:hypothetical protein
MGVRTSPPQNVQKNSIASGGAATGLAGGATGLLTGLAVGVAGTGPGTTAPGICTTAPHSGHFPFLPAAASGVRTRFWQAGQGNSMGIRSEETRFKEPKNQSLYNLSSLWFFDSLVLEVFPRD